MSEGYGNPEGDYTRPALGYLQNELPGKHATGECGCRADSDGQVWHLIAMSEYGPPKRGPAITYDQVKVAVRWVLPDEWRVLPDGGSTAKAIANAAVNLAEHGGNPYEYAEEESA